MKNLITIFSIILIVSCGARKTDTFKSDTSESVKTESEEKSTEIVKSDINTITKVDVTDSCVEIVPIDTTKPIEVVDNKGLKTTYKNAVLKHKKSKSNSITQSKDKSVKTTGKEVKNENEIEKRIKLKHKKTETEYSWLNIFWLLIPALIIMIYIRFKDIF